MKVKSPFVSILVMSLLSLVGCSSAQNQETGLINNTKAQVEDSQEGTDEDADNSKNNQVAQVEDNREENDEEFIRRIYKADIWI